MSSYFGWFFPCDRDISWLKWGGVNQVVGWSPLGLHEVFRNCRSVLFFANPWDCVDQTSHISSLQNVRNVSDILFPGECAVDHQFQGHSKISGQHSWISATVYCFKHLTTAHIWDYFQGCHIYVWIISKNLNSFHCKLFYSEFCFTSSRSSDCPHHCVLLICDKEIGLDQCFSNWVLWNSKILQRGVRGSEMKPRNVLRVLLAVLHL